MCQLTTDGGRYEAIRQSNKEQKECELLEQKKNQHRLNRRLELISKQESCSRHFFQYACARHDGGWYECIYCGKAVWEWEVPKGNWRQRDEVVDSEREFLQKRLEELDEEHYQLLKIRNAKKPGEDAEEAEAAERVRRQAIEICQQL